MESDSESETKNEAESVSNEDFVNTTEVAIDEYVYWEVELENKTLSGYTQMEYGCLLESDSNTSTKKLLSNISEETIHDRVMSIIDKLDLPEKCPLKIYISYYVQEDGSITDIACDYTEAGAQEEDDILEKDTEAIKTKTVASEALNSKTVDSEALNSKTLDSDKSLDKNHNETNSKGNSSSDSETDKDKKAENPDSSISKNDEAKNLNSSDEEDSQKADKNSANENTSNEKDKTVNSDTSSISEEVASNESSDIATNIEEIEN